VSEARRCGLISLALVGIGAALALPADQRPAFDVASLKPSPPPPPGQNIMIKLGGTLHGVVSLTNVTLSECIVYAYDLAGEGQVAGPDWIRERQLRVDFTAKAAPDTPNDQLLLMTQRLLQERFGLALHTEPRRLFHYDLSVSKKGSKLHESKEEGATILREYGPGQLSYQRLSMRALAGLLSRQLRQPVINRTGLAGSFDVSLEWAPSDPDATAVLADGPERPDIFRALEEQLGLRLEMAKTPIDVLVIDHADKVPGGN
jgi:uncharacterized protein (TIGR03435 family)